ncbi:MAG TPA: NUDIX domain-containing protein [Candidatus Avipropionibacterium avicola]|uniref:NUDIX domain-containing protein n=1 Tax=Candidatus Avipropionibacterium avicola TaxID=2840701 RepID=A0A9D1GXM2_9ACTN|nr:NUDIX domain-containing protein [Candidatus Avipropionibacterium avicola]
MTEGEFTVSLHALGDGIGELSWTGSPQPEALTRALSHAGDEAILAEELRRIEAQAPGQDRAARHALLRSGFRQEGVRRQAHVRDDGSFDDIVCYARLASDRTAGPDAFTAVMNSALPRKRLIAHVAIRDDQGRFLLCRTSFKADWELPGGIVEVNETPRAGAAREIVEELGVDWPVGRLLLADWMPPYLGWEDALELIFDGGTIADDDLARITPDGREIIEVDLVDLEAAGELVTPLSHRRLTTIAGLAPDAVVHSEDGRPVG